jgi:hypothetical protein
MGRVFTEIDAAAWHRGRIPLRAVDFLAEGLFALQSKVSAHSSVAPCLVAECLVAMPLRVLQVVPCGGSVCVLAIKFS